MKASLSVLISGSELLDGRVQDINSSYLATASEARGIKFLHALSCGDSLDVINACLEFLVTRSSIIVISGGMGPTSDDLTREAIAAFCRTKLVLQADQLDLLKARYQARGRTLEKDNEKQALFPEGSRVVPNEVGTAPGVIHSFVYGGEEKIIVALPGVPREFQSMCETTVFPFLESTFSVKDPAPKRVIRVFGKTEAAVNEMVHSLSISDSTLVAYQAKFPEIVLVLRNEKSTNQLERDFETICTGLKPYVFSTSLERGIEHTIVAVLDNRNLSIALAESCTGGIVSSLLTRVPGVSRTFLGGVVSYSNEAKSEILRVDKEIIQSKGAVSEECAIAMADGARLRFSAKIGLSITGIAGPDGGSPDKPVGTFYVGMSTAEESKAVHYFYPAERERVRVYAAHAALEMVRRFLIGT